MVAKKRAHKTQVLILQTYQGSELGSLRCDSGMIRAWFGVWFGNHFFWSEEDLLLESLLPTVNLLRLLLNGCNGSTCQTTLDRTWIWRMWSYMRMYDLYPPACRRLFWMFFSCTFSSATLRLMFLFDGFLVWLPASQPQPESSSSSASSATQQAASHAASQPQLASPIASHPTGSSNWASHLASQPARNQSQPA